MASATASPVGAETLKERSAQIDAACIAVRPREASEIEERKQVAKINVSNRGPCAEDDDANKTHDDAPPAADGSVKVLTNSSQERNGTKL